MCGLELQILGWTWFSRQILGQTETVKNYDEGIVLRSIAGARGHE